MSLFHYCATTLCVQWIRHLSCIKVERQLTFCRSVASEDHISCRFCLSIWLHTFSRLRRKTCAMCVLLSHYLSRVMCFGKSLKYHRTSWIYFCWRSGSFNQRETDFCLVLFRLIFIDTEKSSLTTVGNKGQSI